MYSSRVVTERIQDFASQKGNFLPVYHTYDEVLEFTKYVNSLIRKDGNSKGSWITHVRRMSTSKQNELIRWIENEQVLCALDSSYWDKNYAWVCDEKGQMFKFKNRKSQEIFDSVIADFDEKQVSIEILCLKARQLGVTTKVALKFIHRLLFIPNTQAIMASVQKERSELIKRIMDTAYGHCPWWLVPTIAAKNRYDNGSILSIQSGSQAIGLAQGWTPNSIHLSELADYPDPQKMIEEGLFRATHSSRNLFMVLEGTGGGNTGWLADTWRAAKADWPLGRARLCPIFIPWAMCPDIYPEEDWLRKFPVPGGFESQIHDITRKHVTKSESYVRNTPYLAKIAGVNWRMPIEQKWFWQFNYDTACKTHTQRTWAAQMPCVTGDTRISSELGILKIEDSQSVSKCESGSVAAWIPRGEKPIFELHTKDGRILRGTKDHLIRNWDGSWKALNEFVPGESIRLLPPMFAEQEYIHRWSDTPIYHSECVIDDKMGRLLGYFMGDGSFTGSDFNVACDAKDADTIEDVSRLIEHFTGRFPGHQAVGGMVRVRSSNIYWKPFLRSIGGLKRVIHQDGHFDGYRRDVKVPECIFRSPRSVVKEFLRAVFECDGFGHKHTARVELSSAYSQFLKDIQLLLLGFGIKAKLLKMERKDGSKVRGAKRGEYFLFHLAIPLAFANRFYDEIGFISKRKHNHGKRYKQEKRRPSLKHVDTSMVDLVEKVVDTGNSEPVFDLSIEDVHHFSANGIDVHNCDDFEALTGIHDKVFDVEVLSEIEEQIYVVTERGGREVKERRTPVQAYAIIGHDVADEFYPDEDAIDHLKEKIKVEWKSHRGQEYEWTLLPLKDMDEDIEINTMDRFLVYEPPQRGYYYAMGVDTADGLGAVDEDRTVLSGTNNRFNGECDQQVFEFTSNKVNSAQVVAFAACIGAWYGKNSPDGRGMKYVVEQIGRPGETCQHQLKMMGFNNMHKPRRYDGKKIKENAGIKEGWWSSGWSVPMLMARFQEAVNGGWYIPKSKWLIQELRDLERHETGGKSKMEHGAGKHDDRVRAAAQSYFTAHDFDILTERAQKRSAPPKKQEKPKGPGTANQMDVGIGW